VIAWYTGPIWCETHAFKWSGPGVTGSASAWLVSPLAVPCSSWAAVTPISSAACSGDTPLVASIRQRASTFRLNLSLRCVVSIDLVSMPRPDGNPPPHVTTGHGEHVVRRSKPAERRG